MVFGLMHTVGSPLNLDLQQMFKIEWLRPCWIVYYFSNKHLKYHYHAIGYNYALSVGKTTISRTVYDEPNCSWANVSHVVLYDSMAW